MLTRRLFLRRVAAVAPLAIVPTAIVAAETTPEAASVAIVAADADAEIFRLFKLWQDAHRAYLRTLDTLEVAETRYYDTKAERPERPAYTPEMTARLRSMTIAEFWVDNNPLFQESAAHDAVWKTAVAEWEREDKKLERRSGVVAARRAQGLASSRVDRLARRLFRTRAKTLDGMLVKYRVQKLELHDEAFFAAEVGKDLKALKRAGVALVGRV